MCRHRTLTLPPALSFSWIASSDPPQVAGLRPARAREHRLGVRPPRLGAQAISGGRHAGARSSLGKTSEGGPPPRALGSSMSSDREPSMRFGLASSARSRRLMCMQLPSAHVVAKPAKLDKLPGVSHISADHRDQATIDRNMGLAISLTADRCLA